MALWAGGGRARLGGQPAGHPVRVTSGELVEQGSTLGGDALAGRGVVGGVHRVVAALPARAERGGRQRPQGLRPRARVGWRRDPNAGRGRLDGRAPARATVGVRAQTRPPPRTGRDPRQDQQRRGGRPNVTAIPATPSVAAATAAATPTPATVPGRCRDRGEPGSTVPRGTAKRITPASAPSGSAAATTVGTTISATSANPSATVSRTDRTRRPVTVGPRRRRRGSPVRRPEPCCGRW